MVDLHYVDIGYAEDTVIYRLMPVEIARLKKAPLVDVADKLHQLEADILLVDSGQMSEADEFLSHGFQVIKGRIDG